MDQETATATPVIDAPAPETSAPAAAPAPAPEPKTTDVRMAEALLDAKVAAEQAGKAPESKAPAPKSETESPSTQAPDQPPTNRRPPEDGALGRALNLRRQGKDAELSASARRLLDDYDEGVRTQALQSYQDEQREAAAMRSVFLSLEAERMTDPIAFNQKLLENPDISVFHRAYRTQNPGVSLETPDAKPTRSEQDIANELTAAFGKGFEATFDRIAADGGLSDEAILSLKSAYKFDSHPDKNKLGTFLGKMVTELVTTATKESKAEVVRVTAENDALKKELTAARIGRVQAPAHLPGSLSAPGSSSGPTSGTPNSRWAAAMNEARERVGVS